MSIFNCICEIVHSLTGIPIETISETTRVSDIPLDCLDIEELVLELEETYDVILDDCKPDTICDIVNMVNKGLNLA
ncbi:MAG: hypothetical protein RRY79_01150 [Clostridia bacterium]